MELIDRYVHEVGRNLPRRGRADIKIEIRSLIEDTLEGYAQKQGREVDREMIISVLQEFGKPDKVAASYRSSRQYLVGPHLFPIFKVVLTVLISVISVLYLIGALIVLGRADDFWATLLSVAGSTLPQYMTSIISTLGWLVLVFAVLERVLSPQQLAEQDKAWDPGKLPKVEDKDRISTIGESISIVFLVILLILFNFFPHLIGIYFFGGQQTGFVSILVEGYQALLPWLNLWWIISLIVKGINLRNGRWTTATRIGEIVANLLALFVIFQIFSGAPLIGINPAWSYGNIDWALNLLENLGSLARLMTRFILGIVLIVSIFEIISQGYKLLTSPPPPTLKIP